MQIQKFHIPHGKRRSRMERHAKQAAGGRNKILGIVFIKIFQGSKRSRDFLDFVKYQQCVLRRYLDPGLKLYAVYECRGFERTFK